MTSSKFTYLENLYIIYGSGIMYFLNCEINPTFLNILEYTKLFHVSVDSIKF